MHVLTPARPRACTVLSATAALLAASAAGAAADPSNAKNGGLVPVTCDDGNVYTLVLNGNGSFTPGHVSDSTSVFVPVAFGEFVGIITHPDGSVETITDPPEYKGRSASGAKRTTTCTYTFEFTENGSHFLGTGSVVALTTPQRR